MTDHFDPAAPEPGAIWVPESARGRSFELYPFEVSDGTKTVIAEVRDVQFTTDYVIFFGIDGNILALHHTDIRRVVETTDRSTGSEPGKRAAL